MNQYISKYEHEINTYGLYSTWKKILSNDAADYSIYMLDNVSEMYEYGLAYADKKSKKSLGKYYTPVDAGRFMAQQLLTSMHDAKYLEYEYYEPCVGVGDLLLALLDEMSKQNINMTEIIGKHLHISDIDKTALMIAKERIKHRYGIYPASAECMDFVLNGNNMNSHDVVIMNPPYGRTKEYSDCGLNTEHIHDFYPMFLEKIAGAAYSISVVPQSFIGAESYSDLRKVLSQRAGGFIYAYDNVPASLFNGRKHGVFNTNTVNSTRAAIIVASSLKANQGYIVSPLLRWKSAERKNIFSASLKSIENKTRHEIGSKPWAKVPSALDQLFDTLPDMPTIGDIATKDGKFALTVPASIRYYVSATCRNLNRSSKHVLRFNTEEMCEIAYIVLNSNLSYAFWRAYDGGITLTSSLLDKIPVPIIDKNGNLIDETTRDIIHEQAEALRKSEDSYIAVKINAGKPNENVKFPDYVLERNTKIVLPHATDNELQTLADYRLPSISWIMHD